MSTKMDEDDWGTRMRCSAPAWRSADGRLRTTGVSSRRFISSPSRMCAGRSAGAFRSLDSIGKRFDRLSTGRRLRGLLRSARVDELHRPSHSDVRFDRRAGACVGGPSKRGRTARRSGAWAAASPRKSTQNRTPPANHRLRPDWRRSVRRTSLRNPARHRTRHPAPRRHLSTRLRQQSQSRNGKGARCW